MLLLAAWSTNGWLPSGHAMRMALDLGLHRALEKLADLENSKKRTEEEERNLGTIYSILLHILQLSFVQSCPRAYGFVCTGLIISAYAFSYMSDPAHPLRRMSLGTGRPVVLRDETSIKHCRLLLSHPMASVTDVRLISQVELIAQKSRCYTAPLNRTLLTAIV